MADRSGGQLLTGYVPEKKVMIVDLDSERISAA